MQIVRNKRVVAQYGKSDFSLRDFFSRIALAVYTSLFSTNLDPMNHQESIYIRIRRKLFFFRPISDVLRFTNKTSEKALQIFVEFGSIQPEPHDIVLFVFVALRPKSTAMVIAGRSVHLTTLFPGQA